MWLCVQRRSYRGHEWSRLQDAVVDDWSWLKQLYEQMRFDMQDADDGMIVLVIEKKQEDWFSLYDQTVTSSVRLFL